MAKQDQGFRVGTWTVESALGSITGSDGQVHHLEPKVMDVLVCLAERANELVTYDELASHVWQRRFVSNDSLIRAVGELRRILGDNARNPEYVATVPKRGYRLIADDVRMLALLGQPDDALAAFRSAVNQGWLIRHGRLDTLGLESLPANAEFADAFSRLQSDQQIMRSELPAW